MFRLICLASLSLSIAIGGCGGGKGSSQLPSSNESFTEDEAESGKERTGD
jgi:hypothetical protein